MPKQKYAVHGTAKGKTAFDVVPAVHVWADSPEEAERIGQHTIRTNPIYNTHFGDRVETKLIEE